MKGASTYGSLRDFFFGFYLTALGALILNQFGTSLEYIGLIVIACGFGICVRGWRRKD